jgi:hypothetical protein
LREGVRGVVVVEERKKGIGREEVVKGSEVSEGRIEEEEVVL